jgi:hypothetical protein
VGGVKTQDWGVVEGREGEEGDLKWTPCQEFGESSAAVDDAEGVVAAHNEFESVVNVAENVQLAAGGVVRDNGGDGVAEAAGDVDAAELSACAAS